ncbi:protein kinase domain-containing protein [Prosthecobacter sp.]|uniref:protein kinase domain-containing protein n=1 Tax=Prosthecobacter sp. TaxID=1965333 RepID=UPI00378499FA
MPEDPSSPGATPANYQRTTGGHLRWQPPSPEHLQELLPAYEILGIIGKGGMGAVYQGRQKSLDRLVAIKLLPPEAADNDMQFVERFKNEARTMAKMNHPAIVHVYDFGETSDHQLYIVMEFIDGTDVAKMIQSQGKLPPEHALAISAHVCDALQYAHTHGVVHRDIKPANILLNMEGQVKVADFGLAKTADAGDAGLTKTNMAMGTPDFVAPEALTPGMIVDSRADLYAVGVMLYNMLTGQVPRGAFHMPSVTCATDLRFDNIIGKCMQMDREARYQTAFDIRRDLDVILTTPLARQGVRTISVKPRDLPQKPAAKTPGPPQQQKPGSTSAPVRSEQPPPAAGPPAKSVPSAQNIESTAQKSSAGIYYGIAAVSTIAAAALFLFPGSGENTAPDPVAQIKEQKPKPESKPSTAPKPAEPTPQTSAVLTFAGHRYQFIAGKDSWTEARAKAVSMGAHLATITSKEEDEFINRSFRDSLPKDKDIAFIGGMASPTPDWTWVTGETFAYKPSFSFKAGEMRMLCLERGGRLQWKVQPSGNRGQGFIIEWDDDGSPPPATPILTFAGHRYQIVTNKLKWDAAKARAESMGGHLATITTREENEWVNKNIFPQLKKTADAKNADRFFIGAIQPKAPDGPWEWITGEPFSLQPWMTSFPNDKNQKVEVATIHSKSWDDVPQTYEALSFLVEWDDAPPAKSAPSPQAAPAVVEMVKPAQPAAPEPAMPAPPSAGPAPPADPRLAQLEAGYQSRYDSDAQKPYLAAITALNQSYVANGIARARATAQARGSLAEINALDAEKTTIETRGTVPAEDAADTPESLKTLRDTYRAALAQLTARRDAAAAPLLQLYLGALDVYVSDLTKAGKIEEARQVQALRDSKAQPATVSVPQPAATASQSISPGKEFTNSLGMKFVPVKGTDTMFCIHETRRQDYAAYAAENPSVDGSWKNANRNGIPVGDKDDHPVVSVSWDEAHKFCEWLSKKEGKTYRLPTDEEWSIAVGIGPQEDRRKDSTPESLRFVLKDEYPWGGDFPPKTKDKAGNYRDMTYSEKFKTEPYLGEYEDGFATTAPVMSFKPNKLGLYDLGGNADEWVEDWYNAAQKERATRGFNFHYGAANAMHQNLLSSGRGHCAPDKREFVIGFRIVLEAPKKAP